MQFLQNNLFGLFNEHISLRRSKPSSKHRPGFNENIKDLISKRDVAFSHWKRFRANELYCCYKSARNKVNFEICKAKLNYYSNKFKGIVDSKKTWKAICEMSHGKTVIITYVQ